MQTIPVSGDSTIAHIQRDGEEEPLTPEDGLGYTGTTLSVGGWSADTAKSIAGEASKVGKEAGTASSVMGSAGGGVQALTGMKDMYDAYQEGDTGKGVLGAADTAYGTTSAVMAGTAANAGTVAAEASGAAAALPGLGVALGVIQTGRGIQEATRGTVEANQLRQYAKSGNDEEKKIAELAAGVGEAEAASGYEKIATGIVNITGASILLALGISNPVGIGILAAAGAIAVGAWAWKKYNQRAEGMKIVQAKKDDYDDAVTDWEKKGKNPESEPHLDDRYNPDTWTGSKFNPYARGYGDVFREEKAAACEESAKALYDQLALVDGEGRFVFDPHTNLAEQLVTTMKFTVERKNGNPTIPTKDAIKKYLMKQI
jgi:hypothetical protein